MRLRELMYRIRVRNKEIDNQLYWQGTNAYAQLINAATHVLGTLTHEDVDALLLEICTRIDRQDNRG